MPHTMPPHRPHNPCRAHTPSTSSIFHAFVDVTNILTKIAPAMPPTNSEPAGCITSEPAQTATRPASGPLCTKPGSFRPTTSAASVPPTIAISELTATRPESLPISCADITLKPNHPTERIQAPSARNGIDEGGC